MKLTFIGTGSAFVVGSNYHSNIIVEAKNDKRLLIDCGSDARLALHELGLSYQDVQAVYISHLHADHCGGLEWLAFCSKFDPQCAKPRLYLHSSLEGRLWNILCEGLNPLKEEQITLSTFFDVRTIENDGFEWEGCKFKIFPTIHIRNDKELMPSFGLIGKIGGERILITTDTQFTFDLLQPLYQEADLIFHDCETSERRSGVHAHYEDLKKLSPEIKRKMWLYHYQTNSLPDAVKDGFKGFVKKGQSFEWLKELQEIS